MLTAAAWTAAGVLALLAALHLHWAASGRSVPLAVIPERDGHPLLRPGPLACAAVALLLSLAGLLAVAAEGSLDVGPIPQPLVRAACGVAGAAFLLRAAGDLEWVGFFKSVTGTRFAALDTRVYSPLSLALGLLLLACALFGRAETVP